jgi:tRNA wybutosine-synthesizing protein 3
MTATLRHAQPVLSAASSAGFRESGLQSLRCLDFTTSLSDQSPASDTAAAAAATSPIVAVRSSGLSLESIIGYCEDFPGAPPPDDQHPSMLIRSLVTEEYLQMLVALANERFTANTERVKRFRQRLLELTSATSSSSSASTSTRKKKPPDWEHPQTRRERMRAEGMRRKEEAALTEETSRMQEDDGDTQMGLDF